MDVACGMEQRNGLHRAERSHVRPAYVGSLGLAWIVVSAAKTSGKYTYGKENGWRSTASLDHRFWGVYLTRVFHRFHI